MNNSENPSNPENHDNKNVALNSMPIFGASSNIPIINLNPTGGIIYCTCYCLYWLAICIILVYGIGAIFSPKKE